MLIFAFQAANLITKWFAVILLAVSILIQVYFNSSLTYLLMRKLKVPHNVAAPGALIGASNFFELAVAVAITLFGAGSGAALATIGDADERDRARAMVDKKLRAMHGLGIEVQTRRLAGMLARKGYAPSLAYSVIREAVADAPEHLPD